jgi:hypothetical protein
VLAGSLTLTHDCVNKVVDPHMTVSIPRSLTLTYHCVSIPMSLTLIYDYVSIPRALTHI